MRPDVQTFPTSDSVFRAEVERAVGDAYARDERGEDALESVTDRLRRHFPNVVLRVRDEMGGLGTPVPVWYAYRDGRVRREDWRRERCYGALADARKSIAESARAIGDAGRAVETFRRRFRR